MRIAHVVPTYAPAFRYGGPIRAVHALARAQAEGGVAVEVFTTDADGAERLDVPTDRPVALDGVSVHYFPVAFPARLFRAPALGRAVAQRVREFDLLHLHSVFLWPTWRAARAAARAGVPYVLSPRGILAPELLAMRGRLRKRLWIALIERRTLREAAALHATSELEARDLRALGLGEAHAVFVVPNGVSPARRGEPTDSAAARRAAEARARGPYWLYLGRLARKKGVDRLIEATAQVAELRLLVAGNDDEGLAPGLVAQARRLGLADRVELLGEVRGEAAAGLLAGAVALALPSRSENFGNVVLESLAAGRPVIVSPHVGAAEIVRSASCGRVVEATPEAFAAAVRELVAMPVEATAMGERGRRYVEVELGWEKIADRMMELYRRATAVGAGAA